MTEKLDFQFYLGWGCSLVVDYLLSMHKALGSSSHIAKNVYKLILSYTAT